MATLTLNDIEEDVIQRLRQRAAANGRSAEAEARAVLRDAVAPALSPEAEHAKRLEAAEAFRAFRESLPAYTPEEASRLLKQIRDSQPMSDRPMAAELLREARSERIRRLTGHGLDEA